MRVHIGKTLQQFWPSVSLTLVRIGGGGAAFVGQAYLARHYSKDDFGVYAFCWSMLLLSHPIAERGIGPAAMKFVPIYQEKKSVTLLGNFFRWSLGTVARTSILSTVVIMVGILVYTAFVVRNTHGLPLAVTFLSLTPYALAMYYMNISACFNVAPSAFAIYQFGLPTLLVLGSMSLAWAGISATALSLCGLLAGALFFIYLAERQFVWCHCVRPLLKEGQDIDAGVWQAHCIEWRRVTANLFRVRIFEVIYLNAGVIVAGLLLSPELVANVFVAYRISHVLTLIGFGISFVAAPSLLRLWIRNPRLLKREYRRTLLVLTIVVFFCAGVLVLFRESVLVLFGPEYAGASRELMVFIIGIVLTVLSMPSQYLLAATGYELQFSHVIIASSVVQVILLFVLIPAYGTLGVAVAFTISAAAHGTLLTFIVERRFAFRGTVHP